MSAARLKEMHPEYINKCGKAYTPRGWFEEDCEWAFVAVTFPQYFSPSALDHARSTLKRTYQLKVSA